MAKEDLRRDAQITIRCATQETTCRLESIKKRIDSSSLDIIQEDADVLRDLEVGEVTIETKKPIAIKPFKEAQELGRFVFARDEDVCAGGIIRDVKL